MLLLVINIRLAHHQASKTHLIRALLRTVRLRGKPFATACCPVLWLHINTYHVHELVREQALHLLVERGEERVPCVCARVVQMYGVSLRCQFYGVRVCACLVCVCACLVCVCVFVCVLADVCEVCVFYWRG